MKKVLQFISLNLAIFQLNCFAQNKNIDSILILLKNDKADTNKLNHLILLSSEHINIGHYDTAIYYSDAVVHLATIIAGNTQDKVIHLTAQKSMADSYINLGACFFFKSEYQNALEQYLKALKIDEELKIKKGIGSCFGNIGSVYYYQGNYEKTLDYFFRALKMFEELGDKNRKAGALGNIGNVYWNQGNFPKALDYYFKALKIDEEQNNRSGKASRFGSIGLVYSDEEDYSRALNYYFKALAIAEELGDKNRIAIQLCNIGNAYEKKREFPKALNYYSDAMKMAEELGDKNGIATDLGNIGLLYTNIGKYKEAELYLKKAITIGDNIGAINELRQFEESLSHLYDTTGRYKLALIHYKKAIALKDTLFSQENKKQLVRKEMNYEFEKKEATTKAENEKQQAITEEKNRKQIIITWSIGSGLFLVVVFAGFIFRSLRITRKQKKIIEIKNVETEHQKKIIEKKNIDITDSIRYAKRIQNAFLREEEHVSMHLPEHFILFMPKDIVSGDFYWGVEKQGYWYFAAVDCTGHGVPGAVMSMLGISFLNDIVSSEGIHSPAEILNRLRDKVVKELRQTGEAGGSKDGMDISLCRLELSTSAPAPLQLERGVKTEVEMKLQWAGANNSLNLIRNGKLEEVKPDKQPIGYHPEQCAFTNHEIQLQKGDCIYIYTDGYADQFGGTKGKKFNYKQLKNLIITNNQLLMKEQKEILKNHFKEWKGPLEQVDDVTIFGIRI